MNLKLNLTRFRNFRRCSYCTQSANNKKLFSHTVFLPKTKFPLKLEGNKLVERDQKLSNGPEFQQLYRWQRGHLSEPEFVLHDGPPYANGNLHTGHAINKVLKDTILRYQMLKGNKVHYIPGWDCHGLPIELKTKSNPDSDPVEIRIKARSFAESTIEEQKKVFKSWGILGDWNNYYATFNPNYYKTQFKIFYKLYQKNLIYRDVKPVFWSPSTRTALAEAELIYDEDHKSPSAFVGMKIKQSPLAAHINNDNLYALIWTTTPWTLPSNQAISYNPSIKYSLVQKADNKELYIVANDLIGDLSQSLNCNLEIRETFPGELLSKFTYQHPIFKERELNFFPASHVTTTKGTGLVHTAPAHGADDFVVALNNKLQINNLVDDRGCYNSEAGSNLQGKSVLDQGNALVTELLKDNLVHLGEIIHSYPYDWRTKKPVIIRASKQWFIDTTALKARTIDLLENVTFLPKMFSEIYRTNFLNQIKKRPYWCISRQRKWGVPIPVFLNETDDNVIINEDIIRYLCELVDNHGTDFWWKLPIDKLLPSDILNVSANQITKSQDILDIWFDSGISWANVLEGNKVADMYLEGVDQITGWFQSSLLISVALRDKVPYKSIYIHGFVVDEKGDKMSKSIGNIVDPAEIVEGTKKLKPYGIDTLRWWVACHANHEPQAHISKNLLQTCADEIQKVRSVLRFTIASLEDYQIQQIDYNQLTLLDKYILHSLFNFHQKVEEAIENYHFHRICSLVNNFLANQISALYFTSIKDRLYCDPLNSIQRRSAQYVLFKIFEIISQSVAPIIPHLAEEIYSYLPVKSGKSYFTTIHDKPESHWQNNDVDHLMEVILAIRRQICKEADSHVLNSSVKLAFSKPIWTLINKTTTNPDDFTIELENIFQVAEVVLEIRDLDKDFEVTISKSKHFSCPRCRRVQSERENELCVRCHEVVDLFNAKNAVSN